MMKLYSTHMDPEALRKRLEQTIAPPPEKLLAAGRLPPPTPGFNKKSQRRFLLLRRMANFAKSWRLSGYSPRWLVDRLPALQTVASSLLTLLKISKIRHQIHTDIQRLEGQLQHATEQNRQLVARIDEESRRAAEQNHQINVRISEESHRAAEQNHQINVRISEESHRAAEQGHQINVRTDEETRRSTTLAEALSTDLRLLERSFSSIHSRLSRVENGSTCETPQALKAKASFPAYYLALENIYRGEPDAISMRLGHYLPHISEARAGRPDAPILDLGCGRGEWLALLQRHSLAALGVDNNPSMAGEAQQLGLHVIEGDLLSFLEDAAPGSYGAVTAFQVVEHLDTEDLLRLFIAAQRALLPGGVLILETPNPENLQVSGFSFWLDPTHVRPLPPPLLMHYARYFGFIDIAIERASPWPEALRLTEDSAAAHHLNKLLFCEQDYALIARKPL
jgi:SAM-dependent methyltransferase